jgi:hypothetical protein
MKTKPRFQIGEWVRASSYVKFNYDKSSKRVVDKTRLEQPIIGQIVGARRKFLGSFFGGGVYHSGEYGVDTDWDEPCLQVSGSMIVWLVRDGYLNKPYEVLEEDVEPWYDTHERCIRFKNAKDPKLPWRKTNMTWTDSDKADLRKIMKDVPRDSKGRWIK